MITELNAGPPMPEVEMPESELPGSRFGEKVDIFGVHYTVTDYADATERIIAAAKDRQSYAVSALAVHGLMEAVNEPAFMSQVRTIDLVTPDGQPVRWAMNLLHGTKLAERVYGPDLTWHVIEAAAKANIKIFLFGSTEETCEAFGAEILLRFPDAEVEHQADRFRDPTPDEDQADIDRINNFGAGVVLVGRGCPRQEKWVADHRGKVNAAMLAVGAAFDYGAGSLEPPPQWMQRYGLQWLFRLKQEPGRLWKRYLFTNTQFVFELAKASIRSAARR